MVFTVPPINLLRTIQPSPFVALFLYSSTILLAHWISGVLVLYFWSQIFTYSSSCFAHNPASGNASYRGLTRTYFSTWWPRFRMAMASASLSRGTLLFKAIKEDNSWKNKTTASKEEKRISFVHLICSMKCMALFPLLYTC